MFVKFCRVKKPCMGDGGELERAGCSVWDLGNGTIMLRKANWDKTLQKSLKFSDCRKSIGKQIRPSCRKIFRPHFVFVWFRESNEIWRFQRIFAVRSKCFGKELPPLSNSIQTKKNFCWARKGLGTSLALQCYAGFVSSGFPSKIAQEKRDEKRRQR